MKCVYLTDREFVNPLYLSARDKTGIQQILTLPAGTEIEDPQAWIQCVLGNAAPADDECAAKTLAFMGDARRKEQIELIKSLRASNGVKQLDKATAKWLQFMEKVHAKELGISPDESE